MTRSNLIQTIADTISKNYNNRQLIVAVDGVDASGKTYLADELVKPLSQRKFEVLRASIDGFHNPAAVRYQMGKDSAEGFYRCSFNYSELTAKLLKPFIQGNKVVTSIYNFIEDHPVKSPEITVNSGMILIFDGIFLHRKEICGFWDISIWLKVDFKTVLNRVVKRDGYLLGGEQEIKKKYLNKYLPGQNLYIEQRNPENIADLVIDNNDFIHPKLVASRI
ncbi:MAG: hypothetical protein APR63_10425 [Desulfuromonas sp. SDB]|nr:MAG: hypothetical protein APR63_10425 [Desulfuromonas sp. SDB]